MSGNRIRSLLALAIGGILILILALWIREGRNGFVSELHPDTASEAIPLSEDSAALEEGTSQAPDRSSLVVVAAPPTESPVARTSATLSGSLVDPLGTTLLGEWFAGLTLIDEQGYLRRVKAERTGLYEFRDVPFGSHSLTAWADGYMVAEAPIELVPDRPDVRKDVSMTRQPRIRVRVATPDGKGIDRNRRHYLVPVATRERPGERIDGLRDSPNNRIGVGSFRTEGRLVYGLTEEHIGVILLDSELPVYVSLVHYQHVLQTVEVHPGEDEATFTLSNEDLLADMSTIRFRIVDEQTGEGIPGAGIQLRGRGVSIHKSGSDGLVSINRNPPGVYSVQAMHQAYERLDVSFEAKAGLTDLGTLRMGEAVKVRVNVVDEQGAPREAAFHLRVLDPVTRRVVDRDNSVMFGGEGKGLVELSHLGRKLYCLQVAPYKHAGFVPGEDPLYVSESVVLDTRGGPIPDIKVVLRPASRLVLRAVDPIPAELSFQIYDDQDFWVEGEPFRGRSPEPVELASGTYRVTLRDRQGNELSSRFVTVGAEPVVLDLSR